MVPTRERFTPCSQTRGAPRADAASRRRGTECSRRAAIFSDLGPPGLGSEVLSAEPVDKSTCRLVDLSPRRLVDVPPCRPVDLSRNRSINRFHGENPATDARSNTSERLLEHRHWNPARAPESRWNGIPPPRRDSGARRHRATTGARAGGVARSRPGGHGCRGIRSARCRAQYDRQYDAAVPYDTNAARSMSRVSSFVAACMLSRTCPLRVVAVTPWLCREAVR